MLDENSLEDRISNNIYGGQEQIVQEQTMDEQTTNEQTIHEQPTNDDTFDVGYEVGFDNDDFDMVGEKVDLDTINIDDMNGNDFNEGFEDIGDVVYNVPSAEFESLRSACQIICALTGKEFITDDDYINVIESKRQINGICINEEGEHEIVLENNLLNTLEDKTLTPPYFSYVRIPSIPTIGTDVIRSGVEHEDKTTDDKTIDDKFIDDEVKDNSLKELFKNNYSSNDNLVYRRTTKHYDYYKNEISKHTCDNIILDKAFSIAPQSFTSKHSNADLRSRIQKLPIYKRKGLWAEGNVLRSIRNTCEQNISSKSINTLKNELLQNLIPVITSKIHHPKLLKIFQHESFINVLNKTLKDVIERSSSIKFDKNYDINFDIKCVVQFRKLFTRKPSDVKALMVENPDTHMYEVDLNLITDVDTKGVRSLKPIVELRMLSAGMLENVTVQTTNKPIMVPICCRHEYLEHIQVQINDLIQECSREGACKYCGAELIGEATESAFDNDIKPLVGTYINAISKHIDEVSLLNTLMISARNFRREIVGEDELSTMNFINVKTAIVTLMLYYICVNTANTVQYNAKKYGILMKILEKNWIQLAFVSEPLSSLVQRKDDFKSLEKLIDYIKTTCSKHRIDTSKRLKDYEMLPVNVLFDKEMKLTNDVKDYESEVTNDVQKIFTNGYDKMLEFNKLVLIEALSEYIIETIERSGIKDFENIYNKEALNIENINTLLNEIGVSSKNLKEIIKDIYINYCPYGVFHEFNEDNVCKHCGCLNIDVVKEKNKRDDAAIKAYMKLDYNKIGADINIIKESAKASIKVLVESSTDEYIKNMQIFIKMARIKEQNDEEYTGMLFRRYKDLGSRQEEVTTEVLDIIDEFENIRGLKRKKIDEEEIEDDDKNKIDIKDSRLLKILDIINEKYNLNIIYSESLFTKEFVRAMFASMSSVPESENGLNIEYKVLSRVVIVDILTEMKVRDGMLEQLILPIIKEAR